MPYDDLPNGGWGKQKIDWVNVLVWGSLLAANAVIWWGVGTWVWGWFS